MDDGGFDKLSDDAKRYITSAVYIIGPKRHLSMIANLDTPCEEWPVPFNLGIDKLLTRRGLPTVMLVSGDPFWFGAGSHITQHLADDEWLSVPSHSCFSLCASEIGWALDKTITLGLHSAPLHRLRPHLAPGRRIMATLRDGSSVRLLADYLIENGFGKTEIICLEKLGNAHQNIKKFCAEEIEQTEFSHPVMVALLVAGKGKILPKSFGIENSWFIHDGQISKQSIRAITLSALAPRAGEHLWDLGAGSGSISIEWLLSDASLQATAVEKQKHRADNIRQNALMLGVDHLNIIEADISDAITKMEKPDCIFIGGGLREALLKKLWDQIADGTRIIANGVTLETDRLLTSAHARLGGTLTRIEISQIEGIGRMHAWKASYPITQWVVEK